MEMCKWEKVEGRKGLFRQSCLPEGVSMYYTVQAYAQFGCDSEAPTISLLFKYCPICGKQIEQGA